MRNLALQYPTSTINNPPLPLLIYLTARDQSRGQQALQDIQSDAALRAAKALHSDGGPTTVKYAPLDIASAQSIRDFETFLSREHPEGIDILVNNAGVALDGFDGGIVSKTLGCNYYGTLALTQMLLPSVKEKGRVVNVSSMIGKLNKYSPELTERFKESKIIPDITQLMEEFQDSVDEGTYEKKGWPSSAYGVSKSGLTGITRILGRQIQEGKFESVKDGVLINSCCPGYVKTDLSKMRGRKSPDDGATTPVKLALDDIGTSNGEFWEFGEISRWYSD